ncbi:esterase-like activity of phytase family protein [Rodentibacter pneumotropicus]|uniref:esterase-like activity of phytase family protein n=1 Tax=Rodentibacter pneumotropicus TaxID=758 RepID=UPI00109CEE00|nr:esterase-like activity of phytase family protein [Rodentibacter pneumotropicus]NBH75151.1 esterase-like activity of phytase family protein [Rodentibacter pneumotropicus]THA05134.1 esterase-like activity of phytase family protein [Rodentibacter pneumotropicus]THA13731.1 esterase-like activity of phytase family protein [Rodentibacter pneumotropicus]
MKKLALFVVFIPSIAMALTYNSSSFHEELSTITTPEKTLSLSVGIGSGAFHRQSDPADVFYTVTDRGPNIDCGENSKILDLSYCSKGKIFPIPNFAPTIYRLQLSENNKSSAKILDKIPLKTQSGKLASGISNPNTETAYDINKNLLKDDVNGFDTEALVVTRTGEFYLAYEYGPSIIYAAQTGVIKNRFVPKGVKSELNGADYTVTENLPAELRNRQLNRGFESLALSRDEKTLYFMLQSPYNPGSRTITLYSMDIQSQTINGQWLYELDTPDTFVKDNTKKARIQNDVKISEIATIGDNELIVLERISKTTKFYKIKLEPNTTKKTVNKELIVNTDDLDKFPTKIEGLAIISPQEWILVNDNDFAIEGDKTHIIRLSLQDK